MLLQSHRWGLLPGPLPQEWAPLSQTELRNKPAGQAQTYHHYEKRNPDELMAGAQLILPIHKI